MSGHLASEALLAVLRADDDEATSCLIMLVPSLRKEVREGAARLAEIACSICDHCNRRRDSAAMQEVGHFRICWDCLPDFNSRGGAFG